MSLCQFLAQAHSVRDVFPIPFVAAFNNVAPLSHPDDAPRARMAKPKRRTIQFRFRSIGGMDGFGGMVRLQSSPFLDMRADKFKREIRALPKQHSIPKLQRALIHKRRRHPS